MTAPTLTAAPPSLASGPQESIVLLLRVEGLAAFAVGLAGYFTLMESWVLLAAFALLPDLSMLGYAFGPKVGARAYNLAHTYSAPALLAALGVGLSLPVLPLACIWIAHIGMDRALGYGLKRPSGFQETHLGRIGRAKRGSAS